MLCQAGRQGRTCFGPPEGGQLVGLGVGGIHAIFFSKLEGPIFGRQGVGHLRFSYEHL